MKKENIIKIIKYLNPCNNLEKLLLIVKEDREDSNRLIFYTSNVFKARRTIKHRRTKPVRISQPNLINEVRSFSALDKEDLQKYVTQPL